MREWTDAYPQSPLKKPTVKIIIEIFQKKVTKYMEKSAILPFFFSPPSLPLTMSQKRRKLASQFLMRF